MIATCAVPLVFLELEHKKVEIRRMNEELRTKVLEKASVFPAASFGAGVLTMRTDPCTVARSDDQMRIDRQI